MESSWITRRLRASKRNWIGWATRSSDSAVLVLPSRRTFPTCLRWVHLRRPASASKSVTARNSSQPAAEPQATTPRMGSGDSPFPTNAQARPAARASANATRTSSAFSQRSSQRPTPCEGSLCRPPSRLKGVVSASPTRSPRLERSSSGLDGREGRS
jgi:hypothetical protein